MVVEGKIRHVGVSNFDPDQIAEFARTRPVETVQPPYHLFRRDVEADVLPYALSHEMGVLVYGPLAHGLLSGHMSEDTKFSADDWRSASPVFQGDAFRRNLEVVGRLERFARADLGRSVGQLAVAWTLSHPAVQVAIVGSRRSEHIEQAVDAAEIKLEAEVLARIDEIMSSGPSRDRPRRRPSGGANPPPRTPSAPPSNNTVRPLSRDAAA